MKDRKFTKYIIFAFVIAWLLQIVASICSNNGNRMAFQLITMVCMYAPFAAVLLSGISIKDMGWRPKLLKGKGRYVVAAWFMPAVLSVLGAAIYFLCFPHAFDMSGSYLASQLGEEGVKQLAEQGMSLKQYAWLTVLIGFTYGPLINTFAALGEEVGWRGYMYPKLKEKFGVLKGRLLGGTIWGIWHWPLMIFAGYEYGKNYFGTPILGLIVFCVFTIVIGILLDELYDKTKCIWIPALGHGAINASNFVIAFLNVDYTDKMILGPFQNGIISAIPLVITAIIVCRKRKDELMT